MTREEAIIYLKQADVTVGRDIKTKTAEALEMAIKALEQETVSKESYDHEYFLRKDFELKIDKLQRQLDKIRAEIDNALSDGMIHKKTVLGIIDKYKAEIEPQESEDT